MSADILSMTLPQAEAWAVGHGLPRFRGEQVWRWAHARGETDLTRMTDLASPVRGILAEHASFATLRLADVQTSTDGTRKLRLVTSDGQSIESVLIPDGDKTTQCISSQVGCAVDCQFCATAKLGLTRNLTAGEIVAQVYAGRKLLAEVEPSRRISNLVYMGMGEPLHNYENVVTSIRILTDDKGIGLAARRITVSTSGLVPKLLRLGQEAVRPNVAISLNAANDAVRDRIMPINRKWNLAALLGAIREYPLEARRRITMEYVLLAGVNDALTDAADLARLLRGVRCKVNLIPWNPHPESNFARPTSEAIDAFQEECKRRGLATYLRTPRGDDIDAACGQLANRAGTNDVVSLRPRRLAVPPVPNVD